MRARSSLSSTVTVWTHLIKEVVRCAAFPFRCLVYLAGRARHERKAEAMLANAASLDPSEQARLNDDTRRRFRERLGPAEPRRILVSCGEHSGEGHACAFVEALRGELPDVELIGFGGTELERRGVKLITNLVDDAVMGFLAVVARLPFYMRVIRDYLDAIDTERPDVVVLLDNPGLHMIFAEEAKKRGIPVLYYICPQYWGWAPWRMKRFPRAVDGAIAILPFERPFFERLGVPTAFAGNPLVTRVPKVEPEPRPPVLALLPGSRRAEIERNLPAMLALFRRFRRAFPEARAVLPQKSPRHLARVKRMLDAARGRGEDVAAIELHEGGVFEVLARARLALVKSGTSTLQTSLCRTPQVVVYKTGIVGELWLAEHFITVPWIAAPNLILGRAAVPEFLFHDDARWDDVYDRLVELWPDGYQRDLQLTALDELHARVEGSGATREAVRWLVP